MYTIEDIVHHTGITESSAAELCSLLHRDGYLKFDKDTGQYRLTDERDRLKQIKKIWNQCSDDHAFAQMCSKIEDIMKFGKPLALSEIPHEKVVEDIGIPGLNIIFHSADADTGNGEIGLDSQKVPGLPVGHCLLIKGEPGTGKTTMGMQIALYLKEYRSLFLTFEEDIKQLCDDLEGYMHKEDDYVKSVGWKKSDITAITRPLIKIRTPSAWENPDVVLNELMSILDSELPRLVVIDSISRFRDLGGETKARHILRKFIRNLKCRRITAIFTGEDRQDENAFEEYEVDGVIRLKWEGDLLTLTIKKLRGLKTYKGPHSAALLSVDDLKMPQHRLISEAEIQGKGTKTPYLTPGVNVFPDIAVYKEFKKVKKEKQTQLPDLISTGTDGLDDLLKLPPEKMPPGAGDTPETGHNKKEEKGFKRGETILLVGSAGTGKTLLALNFMKDGYKKSKKNEKNGFADEKSKEDENEVWLNFEGDIGTLKFATGGFEGELRKDFEEILDSSQRPGTGPRFQFIDIPPINLDLNKIVFTLEAIHFHYNKIDRLVIDSITELEKAKGGGQPALKVFLAGLIQFLRDRDITTVFLCRSDAFFKSIDKIEEQISSLVDLIICIRNFDVHNHILKGIYIQKARGREHNSKITHLVIDSREGIKIEDSGWDIENLLAGDTGNIDTPQVFFKLFYENPAEESINQSIIIDFNEGRYPTTPPSFALVKKPSIYTEFWSFRGQFSAGHANTRVLSIADHVLSAFRDNKRLAKLAKYVKSELLQKIAGEDYLRRLYPPAHKSGETTPKKSSEAEFDIDAIPSYRDYGIMVFKEKFQSEPEPNAFFNLLIHIKQEMKKKRDTESGIEESDNDWIGSGYTWENLLKHLIITNDSKETQETDILPFAFPPLDNVGEFMAFFMELLWSHGGDIYEIDIGNNYKTIGYQKKFKEQIKKSIFMDFLAYFKKETFKEDKDFKQRLDIYGVKLKEIEIDKFIKWIEGNLKEYEKNEKTGSVIKLNDKPFKETIKLMLSLIHRGGVINPIEGEFRHRALLSRNWYSRILQPWKERCNLCTEPELEDCVNRTDKETDKEKCSKKCLLTKYDLLPLPLATIKIDDEGMIEYSRSVSCLAYWSLVMLINALSPEIGGNFIESLNAPNYYEKRLKSKTGMPVTDLEVKKKRFYQFDPDSYAIFNRILDNRQKNEETKQQIGDYFQEIEDNEIERENYFKKEKIFKAHHAFIRREFLEVFNGKGTVNDKIAQERYFHEFKDNINKRAFYCKVRQTRIGFYQVEQALHYQLRQLFLTDHRYREKRIYRYDIYKEAEIICKFESMIEKVKGDTEKTDEEMKKDMENLKKIIMGMVEEMIEDVNKEMNLLDETRKQVHEQKETKNMEREKEKVTERLKKIKEISEKIAKEIEKMSKIKDITKSIAEIDINKTKEEIWDLYLEDIIKEFRLHVIFELLTYFYHEYLIGEEK